MQKKEVQKKGDQEKASNLSRQGTLDRTVVRSDRITEKDIDQPPPDPLYLQQWSCMPIDCTLSPTESLDGKLHSCKFIVPRQSFLFHFAYAETITSAFGSYAKSSGCRWFSFRSLIHPSGRYEVYLPLPIQFPIHTLYDLATSEKGHTSTFRHAFEIRIHFSEPKKEEYENWLQTLPSVVVRNVPTWQEYLGMYQSVLKVDNVRSGLRWHRQIVKQSLFSRFGDAQALTIVERDIKAIGSTLISSVVNNNPETFWSVRCAVEQTAEMKTQREGEETRLVMIHYSPYQTQVIVCKSGDQKLGMFLTKHCEIFHELQRERCHSNAPATVVTIQGLNPLLSTPMGALFQLFTSTDFCLHICLRRKEAVEKFIAEGERE